MKNSNIPETDSIQELAHFWDKHDLADFEDELGGCPRIAILFKIEEYLKK